MYGAEGQIDPVLPEVGLRKASPIMRRIANAYCSKTSLAAYLIMLEKNFNCCEEELKEFVKSSQFCPNLVKEEFNESQKEMINDESNQEQDPFIGGDTLYEEPEGIPERAAKDDYMHLYDLGHEEDTEIDDVQNEFDDIEPNYCDDLMQNKKYEHHDWLEDQNNLKITKKQMTEVKAWIHEMQKYHKFEEKDQDKTDTLTKEQLNIKQRIAYDFIEEWVNSKTSDSNDAKPFLNLSGRAGCSKSTVLNCVSKYIHSKANTNFLKVGAPTGTAAFLVKGNTLHSLFQLPINKSKGMIKEKSGEA